MKLFIASILILCVAATNAAPIEEISPFTAALRAAIKELTKNWENFIPGWDDSASVEKNLVSLTINRFDGDIFPEWNPDLSAKENLENFVTFFDAEGLKNDKTLNEYIKTIADDLISIIPLPSLFPESQIESKIAEVIRDLVKKNLYDGSVFQMKIGKIIDDWIESLTDLNAQKPEEVIGHAVRHIFAQIDIPGWGPDETLHDDVAAFVVYIFEKVF